MTRVFLLDDHEVVRRGLRDLLEAEHDMEVVGEAGTAADAITGSPWQSRTSQCSTSVFPTETASRSAGKSDRRIPSSRV